MKMGNPRAWDLHLVPACHDAIHHEIPSILHPFKCLRLPPKLSSGTLILSAIILLLRKISQNI